MRGIAKPLESKVRARNEPAAQQGSAPSTTDQPEGGVAVKRA